MKYSVGRTFDDLNRTCRGVGYRFYEDVFQDLIHALVEKIGHPFFGDERHNLIFIMNAPFYNEFCIACAETCQDQDMYRGIRITLDKDLYISDSQSPIGKVRLVYDEPELKLKWTGQSKVRPHIDHVKFNGPATIVFWKDGTKTVVKHDGKGRKDKRLAILYAFIRKIYGEGKPYNNILNEIEEAIK